MMALIHIGGKCYELAHENRNGWNAEMFRDRYSEVLERYDYIVGDWGYNQLRLKGFFRDNNAKASKDSAFSSMTDYINEYCNFGCAYFVLEKVGTAAKEPDDVDLDQEVLPRHRLAAAAGGAALMDGSEALEAVLEEETAIHEAAAAAASPAYEKEQRRKPRQHRRYSGSGNRSGSEQPKRNGREKRQHRDHDTAAPAAQHSKRQPNEAGRS